MGDIFFLQCQRSSKPHEKFISRDGFYWLITMPEDKNNKEDEELLKEIEALEKELMGEEKTEKEEEKPEEKVEKEEEKTEEEVVKEETDEEKLKKTLKSPPKREKPEEKAEEEEKLPEEEKEEVEPVEEIEELKEEEESIAEVREVSVETGSSFYLWVILFILGVVVYAAVISAYLSGMYPHKTSTSILLFLSDAVAVFGLWKSMTVPSYKPSVRAEVKTAKPKPETTEVEEEEEVEEEKPAEEKEEEKVEEKTEEEEMREKEEEEKEKEEPKKVKFLCPICKAEVDADATSCPNCGVAFEE